MKTRTAPERRRNRNEQAFAVGIHAGPPRMVFRSKCMKQISYRKQRETKNSTEEIEVMTNTYVQAPNASKETGAVLRRHE
jgi:hypothetical protein